MRMTVRFAGYYRTLADRSAIDLELAEGATVEDALARLDESLEGRCHHVFYPEGEQPAQSMVQQEPAASAAEGSLPQAPAQTFLILINTRIVERDTELRDGDVMAIVPPMAGG